MDLLIHLGFVYFKFKIGLIRLSKNKNYCIWTHNLLILCQES